MFERFTERARQVVVLAQEEALALGHDHIGTEHLLLGLIREDEGIASRVLASLGVELDDVRTRVVAAVGRGDEAVAGQIPFTGQAKKVLELSLREALSMSHNFIGTEHVLLGLVREREGLAARILDDVTGGAETVRNAVVAQLSGPSAPPWRMRRRPRRWAYHVDTLPDGPPRADWLSSFGADGWELVAVLERTAIFKRPA